MRISSNFIKTKTSFGYDKKLNSELKEKLASHSDREWAGDLSSMNNYVNRLESRLVKEEKKKASKSESSSDSKFQDYLDIFLTLKNTVAGFISVTFPDFDYADREFKHYHDEFVKGGSRKDDWRSDACETLEDWISPALKDKLPNKKPDPKKQQFVPKFDEDGVEIQQLPTDASSQVPSKVSKLSDKSMLEEFIPTQTAPKGFDDVAGMFDLKRDLSEGIIQLIQNPEQAQLDFEEYGKTIPKGILLYGPPGCGKTYITQALSAETKTPLYLLNISKAGSHYINMTSKNIKAAFDEAIAIASKSDTPCLLFMDEVDTMAFDRNSRMEPDDLKQVGTILQGMDDAKAHNVIIIGATNKYDILDPAVKRRFDSKVFVDIPDEKSIKALLEKNLALLKKGQKLLSSQEDLETISRLLKGYSNSSICTISKEAALIAMRRDRADIAVEDYKKAIETTGEEKPDRKLYLAESKKSSNKIGFSSNN